MAAKTTRYTAAEIATWLAENLQAEHLTAEGKQKMKSMEAELQIWGMIGKGTHGHFLEEPAAKGAKKQKLPLTPEEKQAKKEKAKKKKDKNRKQTQRGVHKSKRILMGPVWAAADKLKKGVKQQQYRASVKEEGLVRQRPPKPQAPNVD